MDDNVTEEDVMRAARELDRPEFSRADIAERLGVRRQDMKESFKAARKAGRVKKSRRDDEGTNYFTLGDGGDGDGNGDEE
jgi:predicted transcriptional regulator